MFRVCDANSFRGKKPAQIDFRFLIYYRSIKRLAARIYAGVFSDKQISVGSTLTLECGTIKLSSPRRNFAGFL